MSAPGASRWAKPAQCAKAIAACGCCIVLAACSADPAQWMDHAELMIRPSHHQAMIGFSFGTGDARQSALAQTGRSVAATIAAATAREHARTPLDTMDLRNGGVVIHKTWGHQASR